MEMPLEFCFLQLTLSIGIVQKVRKFFPEYTENIVRIFPDIIKHNGPIA